MAANLGYEIPPHLYSLLKSTRTLIAKAIGRELFFLNTTTFSNRKSNSFIFQVEYTISGMPTLQFLYFPACWLDNFLIFGTSVDDFPSFQHVSSMKPSSCGRKNSERRAVCVHLCKFRLPYTS